MEQWQIDIVMGILALIGVFITVLISVLPLRKKIILEESLKTSY